MLTDLLKRLAANHGFMSAEDVAQLAELDRLRQCLVRCNGGRFVCAAQDVEHFRGIIRRDFDALHDACTTTGINDGIIASLQGGADYVRDVALLSSDGAFNGDFRPVTAAPAAVRPPAPTTRQIERGVNAAFNNFREEDCGGAFDGFGVTSDADPGL